MDYNLLPNLQFCKEIVDSLISFLYYSHIPPAVVSLLIGIYVFIKSKKEPSARYLFALSVVFALWASIDLLIWLTYGRATPMMFLWSLIGILSCLLFVFTFFFIYTFVTGRKIPNWLTFTAAFLLLPVIAFTATSFNLESFDIQDCVAIEGTWFLYYYHALGFLIAIALPFTALMRKKDDPDSKRIPRGAVFFAIVGAEFFLLTFLITGFLASYLVDAGVVPDFGLEQYGIMAMAVFMAFLGYLIVQYQAFNLRLLGAQALVLGLIILVASQFLYIQDQIGYWLGGLTMVIVIFFGFMLVRGVKKEIQQRQHIEKLAADLRVSNEQLSEFMSLATHEIRNPATAIKGISANVLEGLLGEMSPTIRDAIQKMFVRANDIINLGNQYLDKSKLELNQIAYTFEDSPLSGIVENLVYEFQPAAEQKGITLSASIDKSVDSTVSADKGKIKEVLGNLIDNAVKYTPSKGSATVSILKGDTTVTVKIADTGPGIPAETIPKLFKKFSRADAAQANLLGTGLGLYLAKTFIDAHHGRIWVESEGKDKGSTFFVELPIKQEQTPGSSEPSAPIAA